MRSDEFSTKVEGLRNERKYPPCVRCGECCKQAPCAIGRIRFKLRHANPKCPALISTTQGYLCRLIGNDKELDDILAIGVGCLYPQYRKAYND